MSTEYMLTSMDPDCESSCRIGAGLRAIHDREISGLPCRFTPTRVQAGRDGQMRYETSHRFIFTNKDIHSNSVEYSPDEPNLPDVQLDNIRKQDSSAMEELCYSESVSTSRCEPEATINPQSYQEWYEASHPHFPIKDIHFSSVENSPEEHNLPELQPRNFQKHNSAMQEICSSESPRTTGCDSESPIDPLSYQEWYEASQPRFLIKGVHFSAVEYSPDAPNNNFYPEQTSFGATNSVEQQLVLSSDEKLAKRLMATILGIYEKTPATHDSTAPAARLRAAAAKPQTPNKEMRVSHQTSRTEPKREPKRTEPR